MSDGLEPQIAPVAEAGPAPKKGFFATQTGRIVAIIVGLGVIGIVLGIAIAIAAVVFTGEAIDELQDQLTQQPGTAAPSTESTGAAAPATPAPEIANSEVFTFRNIFRPLLTEPEESDDTTPTTDPDDVTPTTEGTLYLNDIITEDGELKAVLELDDEEYTLAVGEAIPGTPWEVLRITSTQVTMLYGDEVQVTLAIGQGITK